MSDDNPHSTNGSSGKSWFDKLKLSFSGEPQSKEDLVEVITEAEQRELIDPQTREMIEGVIGVNEMRVRDIMMTVVVVDGVGLRTARTIKRAREPGNRSAVAAKFVSRGPSVMHPHRRATSPQGVATQMNGPSPRR